MFLKKTCVVAAAFLTASIFNHAAAQLTVSNIFSYQVIQRDSSSSTATFRDSGTCRSGAGKIQLLLTNQGSSSAVSGFSWVDLESVTINGTSWKGTMSGLPVGGEYVARFRAINESGTVTDSSTSIQHLLVGDIWLCAGQSNMQGTGGSNTDSTHVHTRVLWSGSGSSAGTATDNSAWGTGATNGPCMGFANKIYSLTGVPIGIVYAASGGTSITDWFYSGSTGLFNKMSSCVLTAVKWNIGGFLWYQGENEDQQDTWATRYFTKFTRMRDTVRTLSGKPKLPFVAVQLESWNGEAVGYPLPFFRWPRWPVIRDQQELIGAADEYSASAPGWDCAGLHINSTDEAKLGVRCAASAIHIAYSDRARSMPGPRFKTAWYQDTSRTKIVVQLQDIHGTLVNPVDSRHLGFYVMNPSVFNINDSIIFNYDTVAYGRSAPMLQKISSVTTLDSDKILIQLAAATSDSLTVGYGRSIYLMDLSPVTDSTGIPLRTFFNRPIAKFSPATGVKTERLTRLSDIALIRGTTFFVNDLSGLPVTVSVFSSEGRIIRKFVSMRQSVDLGEGLKKGCYLVRVQSHGRLVISKMLVLR